MGRVNEIFINLHATSMNMIDSIIGWFMCNNNNNIHVENNIVNDLIVWGKFVARMHQNVKFFDE